MEVGTGGEVRGRTEPLVSPAPLINQMTAGGEVVKRGAG